jgi:glycosyltransferase involved in cell wall biosynthesis
MRVLYVLLSDLTRKSADVVQTFNMLQAFSTQCHLTFISGWISKENRNKVFKWLSLDKPNYRHLRLPVPFHDKIFGLEKFLRAYYGILVYWHLMFNRYDMIFTRDFGFIYFLSLLPKYLQPKNCNIIYEPHTVFHLTSPKVNFTQEATALQIPHSIVAISQGVKTDLVDKLGIDEERIVVHPNAFNQKNFDNIHPDIKRLRAKYPAFKQKHIILYTGSFLAWKGVDVLIRAIPFIENKEVHFLFVGGSGQAKEDLIKLTIELGIEDSVTFTGKVDQQEIIAIQKSATIGIISNNVSTQGAHHTSPLKVFEYVAAGLPIIATNMPSMHSILTEKEQALFFEPEDSKMLANTIDNLLTKPSLRLAMKKNNLQASNGKSWNHRAKGILAFSSHVNHTKAIN